MCENRIEVKLMTGTRKKKSSFSGGRTVTIAFSLCLLAVVTMMGMYMVGRTDEQQKKLEQQVADAEKQAQEQAKARREAEKLQEEQKQEAASAGASRDREGEKQEDEAEAKKENAAELESEFAQAEPETAEIDLTGAETEVAEAKTAEEPPLSFSGESASLLWPVAGNVILGYSMDKTVYFATLDQYKYNPAMIIGGSPDEQVMSAAQGKITAIETTEETGTTVTMDMGDGYEAIYGQLKELAVKEGDVVKAGETIGYLSEPTRFYAKEGCSLYFEIKKDGESIDPMSLLQ